MALMDSQFIKNVIAPMMKVSKTVLLGISTPRERDNFFNRLFQQGSKHSDVMIRQQVNLVCQECREAAVPAEDCFHLRYMHPEWNEAGRSKVARLLTQSDVIYRQEAQGEVAGDRQCVLPASWIDHWKALRRELVMDNEEQTIVSFVDPNGGGEYSCSASAVVSITRYHTEPIVMDDRVIRRVYEKCVVVGMTALRTNIFPELEIMIQSYFADLFEKFPLARHILVVEKNYGGSVEASQIVAWVEACHPDKSRLSEWKDNDSYHGLTTTHTAKSSGVYSLMGLLSKDLVTFAQELVIGAWEQKGGASSLLEEFFEQAANLRREGKNFTAKRKKEKAGDDLIICLVLALVNSNVQASAMEQKQLPGVSFRGGDDEGQRSISSLLLGKRGRVKGPTLAPAHVGRSGIQEHHRGINNNKKRRLFEA